MLGTKEFKDAREAFNKKYKGKDKTSCTSVGFFSGGRYVDDGHSQCHIGLKYGGGSPDAIFNGFMYHQGEGAGNEEFKGDFEFWFNYQKSHPIIGDQVLNEGWEDAFENGWIFGTNQGHNILSASLFFTRWPSEHNKGCKAMKSLVEAGVDPDMAFATSVILSQSGSSISESARAGHMPCPSSMSDLFSHSFIQHKVGEADLKSKIYKDNPTYNGIDNVFTGGDVRVKNLKALVGAIFSGKEAKWEPSKDIFYTKEIWLKEKEKARGQIHVKVSDLHKFTKALNKLSAQIKGK